MMTMPLATVLLFLIIASMVATAVTTIVNAQITTIKPASTNDMLFKDEAIINFSAIYQNKSTAYLYNTNRGDIIQIWYIYTKYGTYGIYISVLLTQS